MENNYNEWNPNEATESAQTSGTDTVNETENANTTMDAQETQDAGTYADVQQESTDSVKAEGTQPSGASANPYQQYHNPQRNQNADAYNQQASAYGTQNTAYGTQNSAYGTQNSVYGSQANEYGSAGQGYGSQGAGYSRQTSSYGSMGYNQQGSPYSQQNAQGSAYGTQNQGSTYGTQNQGSTYGTQNQGSTYGTQNQSSAYGTQNQSSAYGTQNQGGAYGTQNSTQSAAYRPAGNQTNPPKAKKQKKSGSISSLLGRTVAVALVFGLVASLVFSGVTYGINNALGSDNTSSSSNLTTNTVSTVSTSGEASDLVDVASIVDAVMPGIVAITNISTVTTSSMFGNYSYESQSLGSGIIVAQDDDYLYICTNNHVVSGAESLTVQFVDDSTVSAEITGTDEADDLAVIQVALDSIESDTLDTITIVEVDDSGDLSVGEATIAIGNSLGYGQSVTTGVISALGRTISVTDSTTGETTVCTNLIQTDAAINSGNSGGALLNGSGAVIGINSAKYSDTGVEGMGYAIPMSDAWPIIEAIIAGEDIPQSAYLGISGQTVSSDVASVYGVPEGVLVVEVIEGTAAEEAGIQSGDIITKFEGESLASMSDLKTLLASYKEGDKVTITVARQSDGYAETDIQVTLGASTGSTSAE